MIKQQLSQDGPLLSKVVPGVWKWGIWGKKLSPKEVANIIEQSVEYGVTSFDHADIYGDHTDEALFGEALKLIPSVKNKIEMITKCGIKRKAANRPSYQLNSYDTSKEHILWSAENSLKELGVEKLDLLLIHRPSPLMQPDEIAEAVTQLKAEGKVLHFGVSNFTPSQYRMLNSRVKLVTNQVECSVLNWDPIYDGTFDQLTTLGVSPMIWSPLGSGKLFGTEKDVQIDRIKKIALPLQEKYKVGLDQLLLMWLMKLPNNPFPVLGTSVVDRIKAAADATQIEMETEDWFILHEAARGHSIA